ncbi:hypothetical protein TTRE_0000647101 [Trichuris trichiura]|uniref:Uncharacterized protein n=1 Tax=Trichuris trichiura TaxID=36087 RepID=A0A077ZCQ2_TRITR|nr:hypothetical protein TTRE_0000647101 [Trichuris trichiura]
MDSSLDSRIIISAKEQEGCKEWKEQLIRATQCVNEGASVRYVQQCAKVFSSEPPKLDTSDSSMCEGGKFANASQFQELCDKKLLESLENNFADCEKAQWFDGCQYGSGFQAATEERAYIQIFEGLSKSTNGASRVISNTFPKNFQFQLRTDDQLKKIFPLGDMIHKGSHYVFGISPFSSTNGSETFVKLGKQEKSFSSEVEEKLNGGFYYF